MLEKYLLNVLGLIWNQRLGHKKTTFEHLLSDAQVVHTTAKQLISRRRKNENVRAKCQNMKNARAMRAKILFFIVKYANLWGFVLPSSSWLLKLPVVLGRPVELCVDISANISSYSFQKNYPSCR